MTCVALVVCAAALLAPLASPVDAEVQRLVGRPGVGAWRRVVGLGPEALMPLLNCWPDNDPVAEKWASSAFSEIIRNHARLLPKEQLILFASDPGRPGKARRLALDAAELARPGVTNCLLRCWLDDPEFAPDAAEHLLRTVDDSSKEAATAALTRAFRSATSHDTVMKLARKLREMGQEIDPLERLGVVREWHLIGPFPVTPEEGLARRFPPEFKIDLKASLPGRGAATISWKKALVDASSGRIDLVAQGISPAEGSVAFAAATLKRDKPSVIELRCGANDNITVWVGGAKVIERASEYRAMMRPDRYAARVGLPAGETPLLVKLTKTRAEEVQPGRPARPGGGAAARWEFEVRLVEEKQYPEQPGRSAR